MVHIKQLFTAPKTLILLATFAASQSFAECGLSPEAKADARERFVEKLMAVDPLFKWTQEIKKVVLEKLSEHALDETTSAKELDEQEIEETTALLKKAYTSFSEKKDFEVLLEDLTAILDSRKLSLADLKNFVPLLKNILDDALTLEKTYWASCPTKEEQPKDDTAAAFIPSQELAERLKLLGFISHFIDFSSIKVPSANKGLPQPLLKAATDLGEASALTRKFIARKPTE